MRKFYTLFALCMFFGTTSFAQQDAMFTKYMFNSLSYNPAYAGAKDHMSVGLIHRTQWVNIPGAPNTQSFTIHTPLQNNRVGLGFSAINDQIGPTRMIQANVSYSYRIPLGKAKLAIGLQGGIMNWRADWSELDLQTMDDDAFSEESPSYFNPNFGAGIYYYTKRFYIGLGAPHLIEYDLRKDNINTAQWAKQYRHYFFSMGTAIPVNGDNLIFKPSILVKNVGLLSSFNKDDAYQNVGAPTEFDVDLSLLFYKTLWVGASFRSAIEAFGGNSSFDSVDAWASYNLANGLRVGVAYDYPLTKINTVSSGSFEIMLGYEFNYVTKLAVTPRYF